MSITADRKSVLISEYSSFPGNTGAVEVQCALLTERIINLTEHCKIYKKDFSCKRSLVILVGQRRSLLNYIKNKNKERYASLIQRLGLRK